MRKILTLILVFTTLYSFADTNKIYVWRNDEGVLVFSDSPQPNVNADSIDVKSTPNIIKSLDTSILEGRADEPEEQAAISIIKPLPESTIRDNAGSVYISGVVQPVFKRGMSVVLKLDEKPVGKPQTSAVFILRDIQRGEHKAQLELLNELGKIIAVSKPVTFYLHRNSLNKPK